MTVLLEAMKQYQGDLPEPPAPEPLPELRVVRITYGDVCPFCVRVYTEVATGEDAQMEKRDYRDGSVLFYSLDQKGLDFYKQKRAPSKNPEGWNFYMAEPYPEASIRMVAETGWITGGPAIDQIVPRFGVTEAEPEPEPEPEPMPIINLQQGQRASCLGEMTITEPPGSFPGTLSYAKCGEGAP